MKRTALAVVVSFMLAAMAGTAQAGWSDNFNGGAQQTWGVEDGGNNSTHVFQNDRYQLHTESSDGSEKSLASYVNSNATNCILQTRVQRIATGDNFLTYLLARGTVATMSGYMCGTSSDGTHLWFGKLTLGVYANLGAAATVSFDPADFQVRFSLIGNTLAAKVWTTGTAEPADWQLTHTDNTYASGVGGIVLATYPIFSWNTVQAAFDDVSLTELSKATVWVDAAWAGTAANTEVAPGKIYGYNAFATIQAGVTAVDTGGTVNVAAGTYQEQLAISKPLTVTGVDGAVLDGTGLAPQWTTGVKIKSGDVTFNNIDVTNFTQDGIIVGYGTNPPGNQQNVHITNCKVSNIQPGYWGFGIYVGYESEGFRSTPPKLTNHLDFSGLLIEGNEITNVHSSALVIQSLTGTPGTLVVRNNYIHDNTTNSGIWIDCARTLLIEDNTVVRNKWGIEFSSYADSQFPPYPANTLDGPYSPKDIVLHGNLVSGNTFQGVALYDAWPSTITLTENIIVGNGTGVDNQLALALTATGNWWGDPLGANTGLGSTGKGDTVEGLVDYGSPLAKPANANALYLEPTAPSFYVKPSETCVIDLKVANLQQPVSGLQAMLNFSSAYFLSGTGTAGVTVTAGGGVWDELIYNAWTVGGDLDVAVGVQLTLSGGTTADATTAIITLTPSGTEGVTQVVFRPDGAFDTEQTLLTGVAGDDIVPAKVNSANIYIDGTGPVVSTTATEAGNTVKNGAAVTVQGTVAISVTATDAVSGLVGVPTVSLANGATTATATYVDESPDGTFNYTWPVGSATANGVWTATVTAEDKAGNQTVQTFTLTVNKNQVTGSIALEGFVGSSRLVTLVATGGTKKTWTPTLTFSGGVASYTLTDVPAGTTGLSAKTAWTLRRKVAVTLTDGQASAAFTGATQLLGGDIYASNSVNIQDYAILKGNWFTTNPVADINGDGVVNNTDYTLMKLNWFKLGMAE